MPIPEGQLRRLEENISAQEPWLRTLQRHIAALQDEASAHETILALSRDQNLLAVLGELHDEPQLFEQAAAEPRAFFEERGVQLPDDATVAVTTASVNRGPRQFAVEARFVTATLRYGVGWSPRSGFYAIREPSDDHVPGEEARP